ncbi:MAG: FtsQ-type POTRA domain-containing protein [Candidatus Rokubacteria bacterium]|nr:FtsQ-type POTRA domain-containing protein [Candidatus Rokubacteria bacterium]
MSKGFVSPRAASGPLADLGERSAFIAGQHPGRRKRRRGGGRGVFGWLFRALGVLGLTIIALVAVGMATAWLLTSPRFAVRAVDVRGASRVPVDQILDAADIRPGTNLWRLDPARIAARVEALPEIRRAEIVRALPNRVTIVVDERQPFTLVHAGKLHWLDEEGRLLGPEREAVAPPMPVISGLGEDELEAMRTAPGPRARAAIVLIRSLLRSGSALTHAISEIDMSRRDGPVLYTVDGIEVRLGTEEWDERLARLEGVLAQVAAQGESSIRAIDLRFRDQVVLTKGGRG